MKRLLSALSVAGVLLLTLFGLAWFWLLSSLPPRGGREPLAGLSDSVIVLVDSLAVPHIVAASEEDALAALGYFHARDRMFQLELLRHAAEGRLAELFGARAVDADRALRELEMGRIARARAQRLSSASRPALEAYARGVNAWLAVGNRALELRLLGHDPESWTLEHSIAIGVLEARDLKWDGDELDLAAVAARLGVERARELLPQHADTEPVIVEWQGERGTITDATSRLAGVWSPTRRPTPRPAASNAWAVGPARSASGKPILANDPHLTLRAPSLWYLAALHVPGVDVVGGSIPGIPGILLGHTPHVAWGFTNAMVDDADYVLEQLSADTTRYRTPDGWAPVEVVAETIRVRGGEPVVYTRRRTANGPLVTVDPPPDTLHAVALRWVAQDGDADELAAVRGFARATDHASFAAAVALFRSPEQNIVYADTGGNIGYFLAGSVPVRREGNGTLPVQGGAGSPWLRYLGGAELPVAFNPPAGRIVTANNRIVGGAYPHHIGLHYDLPYRAARIHQMIEEGGLLTAAAVARQQLDRVDLFARAARRHAARAALDAGRADVADRLRGWGGEMVPGAVEPTVFWTWYRHLRRLTFDDESPDYRPDWPLHRWLAEGGSPLFDDVRTAEVETLETLARRAMDSALANRALRPWGAAHRTVMEHPLGAVPLLGRLLRFTIGPFPNGGDDYTVNVAIATGVRGADLISEYGPSMRHVVDLGRPDEAGGFIIPTGQAGHPLSRHYRDQLEWWREGRLWVLPLDVSRVRAVDTLRLVPPAWVRS